MTKRRNSKYKTIRGVVSPAEWDDDDRVTGVVITTDEDIEYFVDPHGKGEYLLELIDEHVEASGIVHNDDGDYTIVVKKIKQAKGTDEDDEDEDENDDHFEEDDYDNYDSDDMDDMDDMDERFDEEDEDDQDDR